MLGLVAPRRRQPRPRAHPPSSPLPLWEGPGEGFATPPPWLRDPPPARTAHPWWLPPRRLRSG
jgi:hypothetical protein